MDLRRMRTVTAFKLGTDVEPINVTALNWVAPRRILVATDLTVAAADPGVRRIVWRRSLPTTPNVVARSTGGLVFISAPTADYPNEIGVTTLTVVSASGSVRSVVLDRILTGVRPPDESNPIGGLRIAGLAVDTAGNRAFVVGAGEPIAEVDLASLAVTYHGGTRTLAKVLDGPYREATWLANGAIAVTGYDGHVAKDAGGNLTESETPAGLTLVDTHDWSARTIDPATTSVQAVDDRLVAYSWFSDAGLDVFGLDGSRWLHAFAGPVQSVQVAAGKAYATVGDGAQGWKLAVVDPSTGRLLKTAPNANVWIVDPA
jgi:hypothetical protein